MRILYIDIDTLHSDHSMGKIGGEIHTEPKVAANSDWRIATGSFWEGSASALPPNFFV
jgi:hypothetical protein